ncbi:bromodomain-containing protein 7 [Lutzomyia longipalpis]|uniref:bromodomain-containing protein 7 n=1 Tax=Lutzomyia longipalpis TaxID=7200 RepID=UPI00248419CD|nr:bromodomain-containing protein 7 [Lutzomyia longipalpis]
MGSKKHKKHKSERRDRYEDPNLSPGRPPSLKLILKVGSNSTPEYGNDSPAYGVQNEQYLHELHERHKKSKKKKKKKDREKKHKHHHKEKRRHRDDSSFDESIGEDSQMQDMMRYGGSTKGLAQLRSPESISSQDHNSPGSIQSPQQFHQKADKQAQDGSGREPRQCVLKLKQSRSPLAKILDHLLRSLEKRDPHQFFAWPVTNDIAPGYSAIITKPMDFSTMRQKIDENAYATIQEFGDDFRLMCENAIKYNHVETVYHKAAKRLLHVGARMLQPENLMRSLRSFMVYMRELTPKELGFELPNSENHDADAGDSADEETSTGAEEGLKDDEDTKRKPMRSRNHPKSRFEPFVDDMSPEEVLAQVQKAARTAKSRVFTRQRAHKMGFLRQHKDGTTSMKILLDSDGKCSGQERLISLGAFTGRLKQGTGQLQGMREDRRNLAKTVKPLNYGAFSSFAPIFDSRFANLSKEETQLILSTYGDDSSAQYAESILEFTKNSSYASSLANGLLDVLTGGEHRKTMAKLMESQRQRAEKEEVEKSFPDPDPPERQADLASVDIDFKKLQTLSELGIDVSFLEHMEKLAKDSDYAKKFQSQLNVTSTLLEKLHQVQYERLSQPLPVHLSHVQPPGNDEVQLATQITSNITEMAKNLPPEAITSPHALRKAMGVSTAGLEPFQMQRVALVGNVQGIPRISCNISPDMDITPVPMEIEPDSLVQHHNHNHSNVDNTTPVDLETELREFLEGGSSSEVEHDTSSIEQMLLN